MGNIYQMENDKVHLRHIMLYEYRKGVSARTAQKNIAEVYLDNAPAFKTVQKWFTRFRDGDFNLEDKPRAGRPSDIDEDFVKKLVEENPKITTQEIAKILKVNKTTAFRHLKKTGLIFK